ncbi:SDR family NAD(P)-dependent oxidoreductase [Quadrisphaera sp. RL12-1S]|nr:SDR family NAD(P)-dependent oxidoreductase [Quadrisphaera sp. RL12-1S]
MTGGTSGIGRAIAVLLGQEGARVHVAGRDEERGLAVAREVTARGGEGRFVRVDVAVDSEVAALARAAGAGGPIDHCGPWGEQRSRRRCPTARACTTCVPCCRPPGSRSRRSSSPGRPTGSSTWPVTPARGWTSRRSRPTASGSQPCARRPTRPTAAPMRRGRPGCTPSRRRWWPSWRVAPVWAGGCGRIARVSRRRGST